MPANRWSWNKDWCREADKLVQKRCQGVEVTHNFQSNEVLVTDT